MIKYMNMVVIFIRMKFPDSSFNSFAMLFIAVLLSSITGIAIQSVLGRPSAIWAQGVVFAVAFLVGFGIVYGPSFIRGYTGSSNNRPT
jgi:hypothetical protein